MASPPFAALAEFASRRSLFFSRELSYRSSRWTSGWFCVRVVCASLCVVVRRGFREKRYDRRLETNKKSVISGVGTRHFLT